MCQDCGCAVPASQREEHRRTSHAQINCSECGTAIAKGEEARHFSRHCPKVRVGCRFCPVELPRQDIRDHERNCDSKTERCDKCTEHVFVSDLLRHREICSGELVALPCEFCSASVSPGKLMAHQRDCARQRGIDVPAEERVQPVESPLYGAVGGARVIYSGGGTPQGMDRCEGNLKFRSNSGGDEVALPCEVCEELYPASRLVQHQRDCLKNQDRQVENPRRCSAPNQPTQPTFAGVEQAHRTRVTYISSIPERERSLSNLEFEDDPDCDLDVSERLPRGIQTDIFGGLQPLSSGMAFSRRITFGNLRNSK